MNIQTSRMANSSYTKLFFPCSESGANVDPLDVVRAVQSVNGGINVGDGLKVAITTQAASSTVTGGALPTLTAADSVIWFNVIGNICTDGFSFANCFYGDMVNNTRIGFKKDAFGGVTAELAFGGGTTVITGITNMTTGAGNLYGVAVVMDRATRTAYVLIDGVLSSDVITYNTIFNTTALNPEVQEIGFSNYNSYSSTLFAMAGGIPADTLQALAFMSARHKVGDLKIWPEWETK